MLDGFAPPAHLLLMLVEPSLDGLEDVFVFQEGNPALLDLGAAILDGAMLAGSGQIAAQGQSLFLIRVVVDQVFTGRADVGILLPHIAKVLLSKPALGLAA